MHFMLRLSCQFVIPWFCPVNLVCTRLSLRRVNIDFILISILKPYRTLLDYITETSAMVVVSLIGPPGTFFPCQGALPCPAVGGVKM